MLLEQLFPMVVHGIKPLLAEAKGARDKEPRLRFLRG
jgi:hypothetical protein